LGKTDANSVFMMRERKARREVAKNNSGRTYAMLSTGEGEINAAHLRGIKTRGGIEY